MVTYAKVSLKRMNPRDLGGKAEEVVQSRTVWVVWKGAVQDIM